MVFSVHACALIGMEPHPILCEVDLAPQLPTFTLVGLPSSITQESRERIRAAVANSGFEWPPRKVTINLLPANLPKWGSHFELAMALGVLGAAAELPARLHVFALGELSLSGDVRSCGWLSTTASWLMRRATELRRLTGDPFLILAHDDDVRQLVSVAPDIAEVCELHGVRTLVDSFRTLSEAAERVAARSQTKVQEQELPEFCEGDEDVDRLALLENGTLSQVRNEPLGVVAALAALAGGHHCLFAGAHGMGKSMLIRGICEVLPPLAGAAEAERAAVLRTFGESFAVSDSRVVHLQTSATRAALEGALLNTGQVIPGELTRAHLGVLVADELLEFRRDVIECLRQPLDEGIVRLQRAKFRTVLPAKLQLLASTNLCPCGLHGKGRKECRCPKSKRQSYQVKLSGPILDRFDLIVVVGQRGSDVREVCIPPDLIPDIEQLCDPETWPHRLARAAELARNAKPDYPENPAELWAEVTCTASDRGRVKLARVARTLARLLDEPRGPKHLRLAMLIRQDLAHLLQEELTFRLNQKLNHSDKLIKSDYTSQAYT